MLRQRVLTEMLVIFYASKLTEEINYVLWLWQKQVGYGNQCASFAEFDKIAP
jgi:hypothetical protein